jgi:fibronectin type 3 domain-containing protein
MGMIAHPAQVSVSVNPAGLATGTYTATMTIRTARGGRISVPVTLTVTSASSSPPNSSKRAILTRDPDTSANLAGYKVYVGTASGNYSSSLSVGNVTSYTASNLGVGNTYYFAVTAYNSSGVETGFSNEVSKSIY